MKIILSSRGLFLLAVLTVVATNIVMLTGVISNRSGEPEAKIILSERELPLSYRGDEENSGLALRLAWRVLGKDSDNDDYSNWNSPVWFSVEKLEELGFNMIDSPSSNAKESSYKQPIPRDVFIVLENNGELYKEALRRAEIEFKREEGLFNANRGDKRLSDDFERAEKRLKRERMTQTRLFAVDAGLEPDTLRNRYGDRARFIITRGSVRPTYNYDGKRGEMSGYITGLSVEDIHVPLEHRKVFDAALLKEKTMHNEYEPFRYKVVLAYGSRLEPWILSVKGVVEK